MTRKKIDMIDQRMFQWMEYTIGEGKALHQKDWLEKIGFPISNIGHVKSGKQSFTRDQIVKAARLINGNINWLFGLETNMLLVNKKKTALQLLKEATKAVEESLSS